MTGLPEILDAGCVALLLLPPTVESLAPAVLNEVERFRFQSLARPEDAATFLRTRQLLAEVSQTLWGIAIPVESEVSGRPVWRVPGAPAISISHAAGWVAVALSFKAAVGVDIEDERRSTAFLAIARRYFTPRELSAVEKGGAAAFFDIWTRKESRLKAEGLGLAGHLAKMDVFAQAEAGWVFDSLQPEPGIRVCVCHSGPPGSLCCLIRGRDGDYRRDSGLVVRSKNVQ